MSTILTSDRERLRELAKPQLELANSVTNQRLEKEWLAHNTFRGKRPMIHLELWTFEEDVVPPLLRCQGEDARRIERSSTVTSSTGSCWVTTAQFRAIIR